MNCTPKINQAETNPQNKEKAKGNSLKNKENTKNREGREFNGSFRRRLRRIESLNLLQNKTYKKGTWDPVYEKYIEEEKVEFLTDKILHLCLSYKVTEKYDLKCPMDFSSETYLTLFDCYCCKFFYKIYSSPSVNDDFVICGY